MGKTTKSATNKTEKTLKSGIVVGHSVRFLPGKVMKLGVRATKTYAPVVSGFLHLLVDGKGVSAATDIFQDIKEGENPTNEDRLYVYNTLVKTHPLNEVRELVETVRQSDTGTYPLFKLSK